MVIVKIELWPGGDESKKKRLGVAAIANDGSSTDSKKGNYTVALSHSGQYASKRGVWKKGRVENHRRMLSPYHLVFKALKAALKIK